MGKKRIRFGSRDKKTEDFVDPDKDPYSYLKRYILEENYKDWFERNYPDNTIYSAVGLNEWDYNEMKKKLSANQDTVEDTSKLEPEPESEPEPEPEPESEPEPKDDGKVVGKWTAEPPGTKRTQPTKPDEEGFGKIASTGSVVSDEQQNITKKHTNTLFWMRFALALIGGAAAEFLFDGIADSEEKRWSSIIFMIVLFVATCFIAKGMKIKFSKSDRKKLVTTGIGSYIFLYLFAWIMTHTMLNLPKDNFSLPFT
uniref:Uncharacterized protein n=1 Tax=uncultured marine thaumarchaeote SAT1000_15_E07 TaxID=1456385 RepID=A0A075IB80_9ARCH|nr:hypothetical protein [uncultured marine thaumarchaeote SAT1000_15_E07]